MPNCGSGRFFAAFAIVLTALSVAGCSSTIHKLSDVGGIHTLSIDAKQRLMLVGIRPPTRRGDYPIRVTCTEPSPDALVARAAVLSANANVKAPSGQYGGGAGLAGGSNESVASIGFRDHTIQMLRDGYFRLCEAYLNGALSKGQYQLMITNADVFMAVVTAIGALGSHPVAPAVAISGGGVNANAKNATASIGTAAKSTTGAGAIVKIQKVTGSAPDSKNAKAIEDIVKAYIHYRQNLTRELLWYSNRRYWYSHRHRTVVHRK